MSLFSETVYMQKAREKRTKKMDDRRSSSRMKQREKTKGR
jgi:hypothetical protein